MQSPRWLEVSVLRLHSMRRCRCAQLRWKLQLLRGAAPSKTQLRKILRGHRAHPSSGTPTKEVVQAILSKRPNTVFVTISRRGSQLLNSLATQVLFEGREPLGILPVDPDDNPNNFRGLDRVDAEPVRMFVFEGMRVTVTRNETNSTASSMEWGASRDVSAPAAWRSSWTPEKWS